jgi:hypothetical protein
MKTRQIEGERIVTKPRTFETAPICVCVQRQVWTNTDISAKALSFSDYYRSLDKVHLLSLHVNALIGISYRLEVALHMKQTSVGEFIITQFLVQISIFLCKMKIRFC